MATIKELLEKMIDKINDSTEANSNQEASITELLGRTVDSSLSTESENPVQNKVIAARISELSEQIGDMDSGLPEVTTADNGKVMQVVDGVWGAVEVVDGNTVLFYADGNEVTY